MAVFKEFDPKKQPQYKIELHVHLDGAVRMTTIWELAQKKGIKLHARTLNDLYDICSVKCPSTLASFLKAFDYILPVISCDASAIERIAYEFCEDASRQGVLYTEVRYCPHLLSSANDANLNYSNMHLSPREVVMCVNKGIARGTKDANLTVRSILSCFRSKPEWSREILDLCIEFQKDGVVGIDVAGDESLCLASDTEIEVFQQAFNEGIHRTVHAGEAGPAANVLRAVELLKAERIGHGYHVVDDAEIYSLVQECDIHFEVCPYSSCLTGSVPKGSPKHPIVRFAEDSVNFSISRDDPAITQKSLDEEYAFLRGFGLQDVHIARATFNAVRSCFLPENEKDELLKKVKRIYGIRTELSV